MAKNQTAKASDLSDVLAKRVAGYFAANPKKTVVYQTTDGFLFEDKKFGEQHATTLETELQTRVNPDLEVVAEKVEPGSILSAEEKALLTEGLKEENREALQKIADQNGLTPVDKTFEALANVLKSWMELNADLL